MSSGYVNKQLFAAQVRKSCLEMTSRGKSSHIGSCLSCVDILASLYNGVMNFNCARPEWSERDRFIMSKGHAGAAVYATLAEAGFFDKSILQGHYINGSNLSGHVSHLGIPGIEFSTGSLGHGLGVACGISLAMKLDKKNVRTFCLLSDGELDEGSNWEAMMFASHYKLSDLWVIIDYNKLQSLDSTQNTMGLEPLEDKARAFGFNVSRVDGHNIEEIQANMAIQPDDIGKPNFVICDTTKGKGVSFMENSVLWHYRTAQENEYESAMSELVVELERLGRL